MKRIIVSAIAIAIMAPAALASAPVAIVNATGARSWESLANPPYGMYSMSMEAAPQVALVAGNVVPANFGAVYAGDRYFVIEGVATSIGSFITNYVYDTTTWSKITDFRGENKTAFAMAWEEVSGTVYGYFHDFDTDEEFFGTIDIATGKTSRIATLPFVARAMAFDVDGTLYAVDQEGTLYRVMPNDGSSVAVGSTGCGSKWTTSGAIDSSTRTMYFVACNDNASQLYAINIDNASATLVGVVPDEMSVTGMYFPEASALPDAPGRPEGLKLQFDGGSLGGSVVFTLPTTLYGGGAPSGKATYTVTIDGAKFASGEADYGTTVTVPVTRAAAGECRVSVVLGNTAGSSPRASLSSWIGPDVPAAVGHVDLTYDGEGNFTLAWPAAKALHDGWFDESTVSYTVLRYSSAAADPVRFEGLTENTFNDKVSLPDEDEYCTYHYSVSALFGETVSSSTSSEYYTIGSKTPPFTLTFKNRWELGTCTIFEGSKKDYDRWMYSSQTATVNTNTSTGADDYLLLPPLMLEAGKEYSVSFDMKGKYSSDTERFEVLSGMAPAVDALSEVVMKPTEFKSTEFITYNAKFAPAVTGTYFIAFHAISDPNRGAITLDNVKVGAGSTISGIETVGSDETEISAEVEYYTLQGIRIARPVPGTICIERRGTATRKIRVR